MLQKISATFQKNQFQVNKVICVTFMSAVV